MDLSVSPKGLQAPKQPSNPRVKWLADNAKGRILMVGEEDKEYWEGKAKIIKLAEPYPLNESYDTVLLPEVLQKDYDLLSLCKKKGGATLLITVPYEHLWDVKWKPFQNKAFKRSYTPESLAQDLETAGLTYRMQLLSWQGWVWLLVEAK